MGKSGASKIRMELKSTKILSGLLQNSEAVLVADEANKGFAWRFRGCYCVVRPGGNAVVCDLRAVNKNYGHDLRQLVIAD